MQPTGKSKRTGSRWGLVAGLSVPILGAIAGAWLLQRGKPDSAAESKPASAHSMPMPAAPAAAPVPLQEIEIVIPSESLGRMRLAFAKVTTGVVRVEVRVPGTVQPNGYREVRVTPVAGGVVTQVSAELGQTVKRGQTLAQLFSRELAEAQTSFVAYSAELEAEHKKLQRAQELVRLGAASREELETVEANHQVHTAHVEEARQKLLFLGLDETQIGRVRAGGQVSSNIAVPAPIDGVVIARSVNLGQVVAMAQELFTVTDLSSVWIEGSLLEDHFAAVRAGSQAAITTPAYPGRTYRGMVDYIDPRVDPQTRTAKVRVEVENAGLALRLGMYVDMSFTSPGSARLAVVPKQAIQSIGSASVVYLPVEAEEGRFRQRIVKTGEETSGGISVLEGLKPGDRVVTEGSFLLRAETLRQHPQ